MLEIRGHVAINQIPTDKLAKYQKNTQKFNMLPILLLTLVLLLYFLQLVTGAIRLPIAGVTADVHECSIHVLNPC